jgi:hypothetical protein
MVQEAFARAVRARASFHGEGPLEGGSPGSSSTSPGTRPGVAAGLDRLVPSYSDAISDWDDVLRRTPPDRRRLAGFGRRDSASRAAQ